MSVRADQARSRMPHLTAELAEQVRAAFTTLYRHMKAPSEAKNNAERQRESDHRKGLADALRTLQPAYDAARELLSLWQEVAAEEGDHCGLSEAQRQEAFAAAMQSR